ncbi:hypothetical protein [Facilibium subflavum]|uniref:hypothetical protein n=1 Tax=Facilibium subflavum TaxID=2219058 RepID=UPI000E65D538|nr:hypothetical protein [Facilibium subflavum]
MNITTKKSFLYTMLLAAATAGFANRQPIKINNNTDTPLAYNVILYHDTSMAGGAQQGVINAKSNTVLYVNKDFWIDTGDDGLSTVFCGGAIPDHDNGVSSTDCSIFALDLFPNLVDANDSLKEAPLSVDFTGTQNTNRAHSMAANGFGNTDSQYNVSYGYNCSTSNQGVPMSDTISFDGECNMVINVNKTANPNLPKINTSLVTAGSSNFGFIPDDHSLYRIEIDRAQNDQAAVTPPLNGIFYQVKTQDNKIYYFYPTTGLIYNQNGTVSPNNFSFYLSLPKTDKTADITECTSDFLAKNNSSTPVCHHQIWRQSIQLNNDSNKGRYNINDTVSLSLINTQESSVYDDGSFALPVLVTIKDQNNNIIPSTDPVYQHLFFVDSERNQIITNDISNTSGVAVVSAENAWLHGLMGNSNYATKYTYADNISNPNNGKMFYVYSTSPTNLSIAPALCVNSDTSVSCLSGISSLSPTNINTLHITDDSNNNSVYASPNAPSPSRNLLLRHTSTTAGDECGKLENPNTPALNYVLNSRPLPDPNDNIPYGAYYVLPGLSDCTLDHGIFCNNTARKNSGYFGNIHYYLQDDNNNTSLQLINFSYLNDSESCNNSNSCTHVSNMLWTKQLNLSDNYDYSNTWQGSYQHKDSPKGDHAILFDNCGDAVKYAMPDNAPDRSTPNSGSEQFQGDVVFVNEFPYPIVLRLTSLSDNGIQATKLGDGIVIGAHNSARINLANSNVHQETAGIEIDNVAGMRLFSYQLTSAVFKQDDGNPYSSHGLLGGTGVAPIGNPACNTPVYVQAFYKKNGSLDGDAVGQAAGMVVMMPYTQDTSKFNQVNDFHNNMLSGNGDVLRVNPYTCTPAN